MPRRINVARLRERLGMSQAEMAKHLGATERSIRRWENDTIDPSPMATGALRRLMDARGVNDAADTTPTPSTEPQRIKLTPGGVLPALSQ